MDLGQTAKLKRLFRIGSLAVLFGAYRFMSIAIATTNVIGNSVATVVTAKLCGEFDEATSREAYARMRRGEDALQPA